MTPDVRASVLAGYLPYCAPELRLAVVEKNERAAGEGAEAFRVALRREAPCGLRGPIARHAEVCMSEQCGCGCGHCAEGQHARCIDQCELTAEYDLDPPSGPSDCGSPQDAECLWERGCDLHPED